MRLWHQDLITKLPKKQLMGQHRECCALRGMGWGKKHSVVDYAFKYKLHKLELYHMLVIQECMRRGTNIDSKWKYIGYRGKALSGNRSECSVLIPIVNTKVYSEHNAEYYEKCIENLRNKGHIIK